MSWTTGTQTECLGANSVNGTTLATSSAIAVISPQTGAAYTPASFWLPSYGIGKSLLIKASGVMGTTATPSLNLGITADSAPGTALANLTLGTAGVVAVTGSVAQVASGTNMPWELDCVVTCVTTGATGTFLADGTVKVYDTNVLTQSIRIASSAANPNTAVTLSTLTAYYWELTAIWSASNASNTITCLSYIVLGLN